METLDISLNSVKNISTFQPRHKVKALKNLSNYFNDKDLVYQQNSDITSKMAKENINCIDKSPCIQEASHKEEKGKDKRKRRSNNAVTPKKSIGKLSNNNNLSESLPMNKSEKNLLHLGKHNEVSNFFLVYQL